MKESEIGIKVGKVINRFKVAKYFDLTIEDNNLEWMRMEEQIQQEEELDGIYIIKTNEPEESISTEDTVRRYKNLSRIEHIYRTVKGLDILIRPIRHGTKEHVRAHIFLCMLAYNVEQHMRKALAPILFEDEEVDSLRKTRDPVEKAVPSESAKRKKAFRVTSDGFPVHSFRTLLLALGNRARKSLFFERKIVFFCRKNQHILRKSQQCPPSYLVLWWEFSIFPTVCCFHRKTFW